MVFYKESNELQEKYIALEKLKNEYPVNKEIVQEFNAVKRGLDGENEISYQLKKSHIGMYVCIKGYQNRV